MNQNQNHQAQTSGAWRQRQESRIETSDIRGGATQSQERDASNWLLAGYMAHEFLTGGTVLGRKINPGWAEVGPLVSPPPPPEVKKARQSYSDVADVFKKNGTHIPGVVNPTQLAKWIQM